MRRLGLGLLVGGMLATSSCDDGDRATRQDVAALRQEVKALSRAEGDASVEEVHALVAPMVQSLGELARGHTAREAEWSELVGRLRTVLAAFESGKAAGGDGVLAAQLATLEQDLRSRVDGVAKDQQLLFRALEMTTDRLGQFLERAQALQGMAGVAAADPAPKPTPKQVKPEPTPPTDTEHETPIAANSDAAAASRSGTWIPPAIAMFLLAGLLLLARTSRKAEAKANQPTEHQTPRIDGVEADAVADLAAEPEPAAAEPLLAADVEIAAELEIAADVAIAAELECEPEIAVDAAPATGATASGDGERIEQVFSTGDADGLRAALRDWYAGDPRVLQEPAPRIDADAGEVRLAYRAAPALDDSARARLAREAARIARDFTPEPSPRDGEFAA